MENIIAKSYNICLDTKEVKPVVDKKFVFQVGDSVIFKIDIQQDKLPKNITGCSVDFIVVRESTQTVVEQKYNNGLNKIKIIDALNGKVEIIPKSDITSVADTMLGGLTIYDNDEIIFSQTFYFTIIDNISKNALAAAQNNIETLIKLDKLMDDYRNKLVIIDGKVVDLEGRIGILENIANGGGAGHAHTNKAILDKLSDTNGKLQYNGVNVGSDIDLSNYVTKVTGKSLISDSEITRLANVSNYNDMDVRNLIKQKANITDLHVHSNKTELDKIAVGDKSKIDNAYTHSTSSHAPTTAQKNSDITKAEIEAKLIGDITTHVHSQYSLNTHGHSGVYEPANVNIQDHISSTHAPSNAQRNADITKAEIEAKLTGEISTHTHPNMGGGSATPVVDNLTSTSPTSALSANQGKILDDKITILNGKIGDSTSGLTKNVADNTSSIAEITQQQATDLSLSGTTLKLKKADGTTVGIGVTLPSGGEGHTHTNKSVLDGITQEKVTQWDSNSGGGSYTNNDFSFNAEVLLDITTFDGGNEAMHPKALYFEEGFGGFKFWLAYSPYTDWSELVETPCIACSHDGVNWETPEGVTNPLDKFESVATTFLSDPHLVYNSTTKYIEIWYRENERNVAEKIWRRKSLDGKVWTEKELLITIPSTANKTFISPSVIYEDNKYKIWGSKEIAQAKRVLTYYESTDGTNWNLIRDIDLGRAYGELGYAISHFDIIHTSVGYELIAQDTTDNLRYIIYMNSQDNITYGNLKLLMERRPTGYKYFDDDRMYRPCIMKVKEDYWCYYSGSCVQPTGGSASDREWKTGVVVLGKSILNADKVTKGIYDRKLNELKSSYKASKSLEVSNQVNDRLDVNIRTISQFLYEDSSFVKENNCLYVVLDGNKAFKYFDYYYGQNTGGGGGTNPPTGLTTENLQVHYDVTKSTISSTQINDLTTNNNHGLFKNFTTTPTTSGIVFSTNQHIELTNTIIFGANDYTIEVFAKLPSQADGNIFCKRYSSSNNVSTSISSTTTPTLTNRIAGLENGTATSRSLYTAYTTFIADVWSHIVFVKTGIQVEIWINGVKVSNVNGGYLIKLDETTTTKSYIGTSLGTGSFLKGTIKSFRYYNKALTETEIKNNYNYELS